MCLHKGENYLEKKVNKTTKEMIWAINVTQHPKKGKSFVSGRLPNSNMRKRENESKYVWISKKRDNNIT